MNHPIVRALTPLAAFAGSLLIGLQGLPGAEFRSDERPVVKVDEVIDDDLYIFGEEVTIDGEVKGDVIAFGRVIRMNGTVTGDFVAAGQAIVIQGKIDDDVRMAGQALKIGEGAVIAGDVLAAGFSLEVMESSSIDRDLACAAYQMLLAGVVGRNVKGTMANCEISGTITGNAELNFEADQAGAQAYTGGSPPPIALPRVPPGLTIGQSAKIDGGLKYKSPDEADIATGAQITGDIEHVLPPANTTRPPTVVERAMSLLGQFAVMLIVGLCVVLVAPRWARGLSDNIKARPLTSLGLGVAGIIGFFALLLVILVAMIVIAVIAGSVKLTGLLPVVIVLGISGGTLLVVGFWFFTSYLAEIVLSLFAGRWLLNLAKPTLGENRFLSLLVGLALLTLVGAVPYLGAAVSWLVVLGGLGALVGWMFWKKPVESVTATKPQVADA